MIDSVLVVVVLNCINSWSFAAMFVAVLIARAVKRAQSNDKE